MQRRPTPTTGVAMPEWLTRDDQPNEGWTVQDGPARRGDAWTNLHDHVMRVPFGGDETNRVIRAHEMMHAKVSPTLRVTDGTVSDDALQAAEEFRVNTLINHAGFDLDVLVDGSERQTAQRLAEMNDFRNLVMMIAATAGGKACKDALRGVRNVDPNLAKALRNLEKALLKKWKDDVRRRGAKRTAADWASTDVKSDGSLVGYDDITVPIARQLDALSQALEEAAANGDGTEGDRTEPGEVDPDIATQLLKRGHTPWAGPLAWGKLRLNRKVRGTVGRKRIAANTGINPRRMNRMLTDPQRRVFDRSRRTNGGVVVIDMSGSMALSTSELESMMEASPGCTIVGYSHTNDGAPNAWVLASNGRRCESLPTETGGNGVDGPIIDWAIATAKRDEPIVWVCDGVVTGKHDQLGVNLTIECARKVHRHHIHMAANVPAGIAAMHDLAKRRALPTTYTGHVRDAARTLGFVR